MEISPWHERWRARRCEIKYELLFKMNHAPDRKIQFPETFEIDYSSQESRVVQRSEDTAQRCGSPRMRRSAKTGDNRSCA